MDEPYLDIGTDPTYEELYEALIDRLLSLPRDEADVDIDEDVHYMNEAIYWFSYSWHEGDHPNLYSAMLESQHVPVDNADGPVRYDLYGYLEFRFLTKGVKQ